MIWEFNLQFILVLLGWILSGNRVGIPVVLVSGVVLLSNSMTVNLLALVSLHLVAFLQTAARVKKSALVVTQKAYFIRLLGCFLSVFGMATESANWSPLFVFFGLLLSLPAVPLNVVFSRHYSALSSREYLDTVVIPSLVTLVVLWRLKPLMKQDYHQLWDSVVLILGVATYFTGSLFAGYGKRIRWSVVQLSQSFIGLALFALVLEVGDGEATLIASMLGFGVLGFRLFDAAGREPAWADAVSRVLLMGAPVGIGFLFWARLLPGVVTLNPLWLGFVFLVQFLQVYSLVQGFERKTVQTRVSAKFGFLLLLQTALMAGLIL